MADPKIIFENKDFLIINKPAGLLVHRSVLNREDLHPEERTLVDWLLKKYPKIKNVGDDPENRPGIVHRLDKETSGVMIIPLNKKTFEYFKKIFQKHEVRKTYLALVYGTVRSDRVVINKPIGIKSGTTKRSVHSSKMSKDAITEFEVLKRFELDGQDLTLLRARPKTGRTHQIRVHLASIHCPIVGDKLYGGKNDIFPEIGRQFLHAEEIEFKDMNGKELKFKAKLPKELSGLLVRAGVIF
ncbi:MAG: RluA family pseudouridine synthase [Patescibacteria group bacterium]|nr:RluA family pseudouridine synthase [Patescibacteria group bacterium]